MKKFATTVLVIILSVAMIVPQAGVAYASTKSNAEKVLKYYKQGNIKKALKYNKKLPRKASKTCIKRLSSKAKAAFLRKVYSYNISDNYWGDPWMWGYYLVDMDGDKKAELLIDYGTCEADRRIAVYKYKNGKAKRMGSFSSGHSYPCAYAGHAGILQAYGHMGSESVRVVRLKKGKIRYKRYGDRTVYTSYFPFRQKLNDHISYDSDYDPILSTKDLR